MAEELTVSILYVTDSFVSLSFYAVFYWTENFLHSIIPNFVLHSIKDPYISFYIKYHVTLTPHPTSHGRIQESLLIDLLAYWSHERLMCKISRGISYSCCVKEFVYSQITFLKRIFLLYVNTTLLSTLHHSWNIMLQSGFCFQFICCSLYALVETLFFFLLI